MARAAALSVEAAGKTTELTAKHVIIATGARARELPKAKADGNSTDKVCRIAIGTYRYLCFAFSDLAKVPCPISSH